VGDDLVDVGVAKFYSASIVTSIGSLVGLGKAPTLIPSCSPSALQGDADPIELIVSTVGISCSDGYFDVWQRRQGLAGSAISFAPAPRPINVPSRACQRIPSLLVRRCCGRPIARSRGSRSRRRSSAPGEQTYNLLGRWVMDAVSGSDAHQVLALQEYRGGSLDCVVNLLSQRCQPM